MTITRSGVMRRAPLAMRLRANSTWAMLEFVFNGMVFLLLGLQLPGILETSLMAAEIDPNVEIWMLFTDIILIYAALMLVPFRLAVDDEKVQQPLPEEEADGVWFVDHTRNPDRVFRRGAWGDHFGRCALYPAALAGW